MATTVRQTFALAPELRRPPLHVPGSQGSIVRGDDVYDASTGHIIGTRIVQGSARQQELQRQRQDALFARVLGGTESGYFPIPGDPTNPRIDPNTLSPEQALMLRGLGYTPLGGSSLYNPQAISSAPRAPNGGSGFGASPFLAAEEEGAGAQAGGPNLLVLGGAALLLLLLLRR